MEKILISACLLGEKVRYDGGENRLESEILERWQQEGRLVAVCPEVEGGLPTPRPPAEIVSGDGEDVLRERAWLVNNRGIEVTEHFLRGADRALQLALQHHIRMAILKSRSPSCGKGWIYDGHFSGTLKQGDGVTVALLKRHGIRVFQEGELEKAQAFLRKLEAKSERGLPEH